MSRNNVERRDTFCHLSPAVQSPIRLTHGRFREAVGLDCLHLPVRRRDGTIHSAIYLLLPFHSQE